MQASSSIVGANQGTAAFAAMIGLTWGLSTIALMGLGVFIGPLQAEFGWTRTQVALVSTFINLTAVTMSPLQGALIDRFGSRRVVLPSLVVFAVGLMLLYFLPPQIEMFYLSWCIIAAFSVGLLPGSFLRVVGTWFDRNLGLAMGLANSGIGLGNIIVPLVATAVIISYGWRMAYVTLGLVVLFVVLPVCFLWLREKERPAVESPEALLARKRTASQKFKQAIRSKPFMIIVVAFFFMGLVNTALIAQQVPILTDAGLSRQKAAFIQSMFGVFLIVGRLGAGFLLDRVFAPILMIVVALGGVVACLIYSTGTSGQIVYLSAALLGLVIGAEFDVLGYLVKRYFGIEAFGRIYSVIFALFQLGGAMGVVAFSYSYKAFGNYQYGLYGAATSLLLACVAFAFVPKYPAVSAPKAVEA
jgi:MFS family permease